MYALIKIPYITTTINDLQHDAVVVSVVLQCVWGGETNVLTLYVLPHHQVALVLPLPVGMSSYWSSSLPSL